MNNYPELKWVVMSQWPNKPYWEPIAAFNVESVAHSYAAKCAESCGHFLNYKVEEVK
jgi:hypothetical protein